MWSFSSFLGLNVIENPDKTTYFLFFLNSFVVRFLFADDLFSVCFPELFVFPSLDIRLFILAFSRSLSRSSCRILPILASFLTLFRVFLDLFYAFHTLLSSVTLSLSFIQNHFCTNLFPPVDKASALPVLLLCKLITNCKILRITIQLQPHQYDFPLKTRVAKLSALWAGNHTSEHTLLRTLMGYVCSCACTLPSPSPFHYVMAKIAPALQLAAHAKRNTLYGRSYGPKPKLFRLYGLPLCSISYGLRFARCELRY